MPYKFVPRLQHVKSPVMRRIMASGRQPVFSAAEFKLAKKFFRNNPRSERAFIFFDGRIEDCDVYLKRTHHSNPYIASIVSIACDGIPLVIGRNSLKIWRLVTS